MYNIRLSGMDIEVGKFPNGEKVFNKKMCEHIIDYVKDLYESKEPIHIEWKYRQHEDLITLQFLRDFIERIIPHANVELTIYYMVYSRMDRSEENMAFTLQSIAKMINAMDFSKVSIFDAHSDVSLAIIDRAVKAHSKFNPSIELPDVFIAKVKELMHFDEDKDMILYPDLGAAKRSHLKDKHVLVGSKKRNFADGKIESFEIMGDIVEGGRVLIIDDLCSFGGTAIKATEVLNNLGIHDVHFYISHCEDSAYKKALFDHITTLYTTDSLLPVENIDDIATLEQIKKTVVFDVFTEKKINIL